MKYVLLTATEQKHYCDVRSPLYSMTSSKLHTVALFMKDTENVKNYCKTEVEPNYMLPRAYQIIDGLQFYHYSEHSFLHCSSPLINKKRVWL